MVGQRRARVGRPIMTRVELWLDERELRRLHAALQLPAAPLSQVCVEARRALHLGLDVIEERQRRDPGFQRRFDRAWGRP